MSDSNDAAWTADAAGATGVAAGSGGAAGAGGATGAASGSAGAAGKTSGGKSGSGKKGSGSAKKNSGSGGAKKGSGKKGSGGSAKRGTGGKRDSGKRPVSAKGPASGGGRKMGKKARRRIFLQALVPDFLLTFLAAAALVLTVSFGFNSGEAIRGNLGIVLPLVFVLLVLMFMGTWSKRMVVPSGILTAVLSFVLIGAAAATSTEANVMSDVADNYTIFMMVLVLTTVITFLLSRRPVGMAFLLIFGIFACGLMQFLYEGWLVLEASVFLLAAVVLFIYKVYQRSMYEAEVAKKPSFGAAAAFATILSLVFLCVGVGVFYGIVEPLNPGAQELKLFQKYYALEVVYYTGGYSASDSQGEDTTDDAQNTDDTTDDQQEGDAGQGDQEDDQENQPDVDAEDTFSVSGVLEDIQQISYEHMGLVIFLVVLLLVAALVAAILLRRAQRERRLRKVEGFPLGYRVVWVYGFLEKRLARLGFKRPPAATPQEFAEASRRALLPFAEHNDSDWPRMTDLYYRAYYNAGEVGPGDWEEAKGFYRAFFRNAREVSGWFKWLWRFWRI